MISSIGPLVAKTTQSTQHLDHSLGPQDLATGPEQDYFGELRLSLLGQHSGRIASFWGNERRQQAQLYSLFIRPVPLAAYTPELVPNRAGKAARGLVLLAPK